MSFKDRTLWLERDSDIEYSSGVSAHRVFSRTAQRKSCASAYSKPCRHFWPRLIRRLGASRASGNALVVRLCRFSTCKAMEGLLRLCRSLLMFEPDLVIQAITRGAAQDANGAGLLHATSSWDRSRTDMTCCTRKISNQTRPESYPAPVVAITFASAKPTNGYVRDTGQSI